MNISILLIAIWLILVGLVWLGVVAISSTLLGGFALVIGILLLIETSRPFMVLKDK